MPVAKKAPKAFQTKATAKAKVAAKSPAKRAGKPKLTLVPKTAQTGAAPTVRKKRAVGLKRKAEQKPRNVIMELWKAKEEKNRNETPHTKFHQTGPPRYASHDKHDRFARYSGARRKA